MIARLFRLRLRHVPLDRTDPDPYTRLDRLDGLGSPVTEAARIVAAEAARREYALDTAITEMMRPRLTTEAILDGYLALVIPAEERAA